MAGLNVLKGVPMKATVTLALVLAAVALGACRKEVPYEPMKLGGPAAQHNVSAR